MSMQSIISNVKAGLISKEQAFLQLKAYQEKNTTQEAQQFSRVAVILANLLFINPKELKPSDSLTDLGVDSIIIQELLIKIEEQFTVKLSIDRFISEIRSVQDLCTAVATLKTLTPQNNATTLSSQQTAFLEEFFQDYINKTKQSLHIATSGRQYFADQRLTLFFDQTFKKIWYPLIFKHAKDAWITDVDGNNYLDIAGDYGVNLFGHRNEALTDAMIRQITESGCVLSMGAESIVETARLFCEITQNDRVAFCQSGTEAVMVAMRMARAFTSRKKIVMFKGSYHGHFDGVLAHGTAHDYNARPKYPGVLENFLEDIVYLPYGEEVSLTYIADHIHLLAGILVEPIQSRFPGFHAQVYLEKLRKLTNNIDTVLIFDEMITGFRVHPRGVQGLFGIQADLSVYGKIICGGFTGGMVAGNAEIMSLIDGGQWAFDDDSMPSVKTTFLAGTHTHNPYKIAAILGVLTYMKTRGESFYHALNARTQLLCDRLNAIMQQKKVAIEVLCFGSLFRFKFLSEENNSIRLTQPYEKTLFGKLLPFHGINYLHQGNCFLTEAHSDEDLDYLVSTVSKVVDILIEQRFMEGHIVENTTFALSYEQQALWVNAQLTPNVSIDSIPVCLSFKEIEHSKIVSALEQVVLAYPMLRATICNTEIYPQQVVHERLSFEVETDNEFITHEEGLYTKLKAEAVQPINLVNGPTLKVKLFPLKDRYYLLIVLHHIFVDGLSVNIFIKSFLSIYVNLLAGKAISPLSEDHSYRDFIYTQQQILQTADYSQALQYWQKNLSAVSGPLRLPVDYQSNESIMTDCCDKSLTKKLSEKIYRYCKSQQLSVFNFFLSAYGLYIHQLTQAENFLIAIPTNPATRFTQYKNTIGHFVNQLPLSLHIDASQTLDAWFLETKSKIMHCLKYQDLPFGKIIQDLNLSGKIGKLLRLAINLDLPIDLPDFVTDIPFFNHTSHTDLGCIIKEKDNVIDLTFSYNTMLWKRETVENQLDAFINFIKKLLEIDAKTALIGELNTHQPQPIVRLCHGLYPMEKAHQDCIAVQSADQSFSYQTLTKDVDVFASKLQQVINITCRSEDKKPLVGLCFSRSYEYIVALLACINLGVIFLPIDPKWPNQRKQEILDESSCHLLIHNQALKEVKDGLTVFTCSFNELVATSELNKINTASAIDVSTDTIGILYTSGSTGKPKGVMLTQEGLFNTIQYSVGALRLEPTAKVLQFASIAFDASLWEILTTLRAGATLVIPKNNEISPGETLHQTLAAYEITSALLPPCVLSITPSQGLTKFTTLLSGGEHLTESVFNQWTSQGRTILNAYGPTEGSIFCLLSQPIIDGTNIALGHAIEHMDIVLLNGDSISDEQGEICITGKGLSSGYYQAFELTQAYFIQLDNKRYFKTGDLAKYTPTGLQYLGRSDRCLKIRGNRVDLNEIEFFALQYDKVTQAISFIEKNRLDHDEVYLAVMLNSSVESEMFLRELKQHLSLVLPDYEVPSIIFNIDAVPISSNGKRDYEALKMICFPQLKTISKPEEHPYTRTALVDLWAKVLGISPMAVFGDSNFFDLGGNSLTAVYIVDQINKHYSENVITVADFFELESFSMLVAKLNCPHLPEQVSMDGLMSSPLVETNYL